MAKISPVSIKYTISADFKSEGPVEKPDVIGAIFGQTEGLLGSEMELRELQKEGKIGRIDVELTTENGKTTGEIIIPSAMDKTETTLIAAAMETIDKIGPTDAKITIKEIEDVRGSKRDYIMERAKKLLGEIKNVGMETDEMGKELIESARTSKIKEYGEERLPAGDLTGNEIIVVEGRADVVNMLKHGINNVIGMNGTRLPAEIAKLGQEKEITLFVDGDRGGNLIAKNVCENAKIKYIAMAPDGKEVEELMGKEIMQSLRRKVLSNEFFGFKKSYDRNSYSERREFPMESETEEEIEVSKKELSKQDKEKLKEILEDVKGRNVLILNEDLETIKDVSISKLSFMRVKGAYVLLTNTASSGVVSAANELKAKYVVAKNFGKIDEMGNVELISF